MGEALHPKTKNKNKNKTQHQSKLISSISEISGRQIFHLTQGKKLAAQKVNQKLFS
jgi:Mor family transcriptional regulator